MISGAHCLDLFAGSGALGFEAASRGASRVVMVDTHPLVAAGLKSAKEQLHADEIEIVQAEAESWLQRCDQQFDLIFLDPPFSRPDLLGTSLATLAGKDIIKSTGRIYLETSVDIDIAEYVRDVWNVLYSQRAGRVSYHLITPAE